MEREEEPSLQLKKILLEAFPTPNALVQMVTDHLGENLYVIAGGDNLRDIVHSLVEYWALPQGKFEDLVRAARKANSGHSGLRDLAREMGLEAEENQKVVSPTPAIEEPSEEPSVPEVAVPPTYRVIPLKEFFPEQPLPDDLSSFSGYRYLGQLDGYAGRLFCRSRDSHVALFFPGKRGIDPFLIDKYAITNTQFCMFLNWLLDIGLATVESLPDRGMIRCRSVEGQVLALDARSYWKCNTRRQRSGQCWGMVFEKRRWLPLANCGLLPATLVSWRGAHLYALWAHDLLKNDALSCLPTSRQWNAAAQFDPSDGKITPYPWGGEWKRSYVNYAGFWDGKGEGSPDTYRNAHPLPVTNFEEAHSPVGCVQLIGNVWEWCADSPPGRLEKHIIRGGACNSPQEHCKLSFNEGADDVSEYIGFRCLFAPVSPMYQGTLPENILLAEKYRLYL